MSPKLSLQDANMNVMREVNQLLDTVLTTAPLYDFDLQKHCVNFQVEHATAKAAFQQRQRHGSRGNSPEVADGDAQPCAALAAPLSPDLDHLLQALMRMINLGSAVASHVLRRTSQAMRSGQSPLSASSFSSAPEVKSPSQGEGAEFFSSSIDDKVCHGSSVDDVFAVDEAWTECGATLMHCATEVQALALLVHEGLRPRLQVHMLQDVHVLKHVVEALSISKEHEVRYFAVGYKTDLARLMANLTYNNAAVCDAVVETESLMREILRCTKIDDENPHLVEWSEFALRNLLSASEKAREYLRILKAVAVDEGSAQFLRQVKLEHSLEALNTKLASD